MNKFLMIYIVTIFITGCTKYAFTYPDEYKGWIKKGSNEAKVIEDMRKCGFNNTSNNNSMDNNKWIKSALCMESNGYLLLEKKICRENGPFQEYEACKEK